MSESADKLFQKFVKANSYLDTQDQFTKLCDELELNPDTDSVFYTKLKQKLLNHSHYAKLWKLIDQKKLNDEYMMGTACKGKKVLIIGAGPCGLRMAIECAFLGARVTVVEARDYMSRNNVLHLWHFVKTDLKALGAKIFSPQFCTGGLDHISIRSCQLFLLKISLLLGVKVYCPLKFVDIVPPSNGNGWRVKVDVPDHPIAEVDLHVIVGAEGKRHTLPGYSHKELRGRLAIAITVNLVNARTKRDVKARELGGLSYIFDQEFFNCLAHETGVDLENFVYFKDDTHYFVMTVKKKGLLKKGVLIEDKPKDTAALLARTNVNWDKLKDISRDIIDVATERKLEGVPIAKNHHDQDDLAIFDFTCMRQAQNSCFAQKVNGRKLLTCIVGDTLLEPFWPQGTGCARGFLGVFDGAWLIRNWFQDGMDPVECLAEREAAFSLLSQTKNDSLKPKHAKYTIDPKTRYHSIPAPQVAHASRLYVEDNVVRPSRSLSPQVSKKRVAERSTDTKSLLRWYKTKLKRFETIVPMKDLNDSWKDGIALLAIVQLYRPDLIDITVIDQSSAHENCRQALVLIEQEFGVTPTLKADEICGEKMNKLALLTYLALLQEQLQAEVPKKKRRGDSAKSAAKMAATSAGAKDMDDVENYLAKSLSAFRVLKTLTQSTRKATLERSAERSAVWNNSLSRSTKKPDKGLKKLKNTILLSSSFNARSKPLSLANSIQFIKSTISRKKNKSDIAPEVPSVEDVSQTVPNNPSDAAWLTSAIRPSRGSATSSKTAVEPGEDTEQQPGPGELKPTKIAPHPMAYRPSLKHCKGIAASRISAIRDSGQFESIIDEEGSEDGRQRSNSSPPEIQKKQRNEFKPSGPMFSASNEALHTNSKDIIKPNPSDSPKMRARFQSPRGSPPFSGSPRNSPVIGGSPRNSPVTSESPRNSPVPDDDSDSDRTEKQNMDFTKSLARQACRGKAGNLIAMFQKGPAESIPKDETDSPMQDTRTEDKPPPVSKPEPLYDNVPLIRIQEEPEPDDNMGSRRGLSQMRLMSKSIMACRGKVASRLSAFTEEKIQEDINEEPETNEITPIEQSDKESDLTPTEHINTNEVLAYKEQTYKDEQSTPAEQSDDENDITFAELTNKNELTPLEQTDEEQNDMVNELTRRKQSDKDDVITDLLYLMNSNITEHEKRISSSPSVYTKSNYSEEKEQPDTHLSDEINQEYERIPSDVDTENQAQLSRVELFGNDEDAKDNEVAQLMQNTVQSMKTDDYDSDSEDEAANMCYICEKVLFVVNRISAHGKCFHRNCFKCTTCDTHLRVGNSFELKEESGKANFYCQSHYFMAGAHGVSSELLSRSLRRLKLADVTESQTSTDASLRFDAIAETADQSSSDEDDIDALVANNMYIGSPKASKPRKHVMFSDSSADSSDDSDSEDETDAARDARMLIADEIQQGLEEVEEEEEELQERGVELEEKLVQGEEDTQVVNEWLAISLAQNKLKEKASKLMLKKKLMELSEMINRCQLEYLELVDDDDEEGLQLKADEIEREMEELTHQMKSVKLFLNRGESAS